MKKDPNERATLEEIQKDKWVMHDGSSNLNEVEFYRDEDKGFGNIDRLIHLKQAGTIGQLP